jgi:nicotinic acid mononucleotide adenylyltransferase
MAPKTVGKERIVLLATGSFNPVHRAHVSMAVWAKSQLEQLRPNSTVCAAVFSASHDYYVSDKLGSEAIHGKHRMEMMRRALEEDEGIQAIGSDFAFVDPWETNQEDWIDFPETTAMLQRRLNTVFGDGSFTVYFLCGSDLGWCLFESGLRCDGQRFKFVAVKRPGAGYSRRFYEDAAQLNPEYGLLIEGQPQSETGISSTRIRQAIANDDMVTLAQLTYSTVIEYMCDHDLLQSQS